MSSFLSSFQFRVLRTSVDVTEQDAYSENYTLFLCKECFRFQLYVICHFCAPASCGNVDCHDVYKLCCISHKSFVRTGMRVTLVHTWRVILGDRNVKVILGQTLWRMILFEGHSV